MKEVLNKNRYFNRYYIANIKRVEGYAVELFNNVDHYDFVREIENYPKALYSSESVLSIFSEPVRTSEKKKFALRFSSSMNVADCDCFSFGYNGNYDCQYLMITLYSTTNERFASLISVTGERWTTVILDVKNCTFLKNIAGIEFVFYGKESECVMQTVVEFSDVRFGSIFDFDFLIGDYCRFFMPQNKIYALKKGLSFQFLAGDELIFPQFDEPRYSEASFRLSVQDHIRLVIQNRSDDERFLLYVSTNKQPEFDELRKIAVLIPTYRAPQSYLIPLSSLSFSENEQIRGLKLVPLSASGELDLLEMSFEQELSSLSPSAMEFLSKPILPRLNPFALDISDTVYLVQAFGARGDGFTDDTKAIQSSINFAYIKGGGKVVLGGGGRYIATHLELKSHIELVIEKDSILLQSSRITDYSYVAQYEHDNIDAKVNWAHNFLVCNKPLLYAIHAEDIKISGGGTIRMMDRGFDSRKVGFPYWPNHCGGIIHIAPIGLQSCKNLEISNLSILRASTYHCFLVRCENVYLRDMVMAEVRCLSADGVGLAGSKNVVLSHCLIETNDDGVTLCSMYRDARAGGWWKATPDEDNSVRNIEIENSYIDSGFGGGGKAISFIPWGTDAPDQNKQVIQGIFVHDNILKGGYSVGAWADNPYFGKQPFDNQETDDYSPVMDVNIQSNIYVNPTSLACIEGTFIQSDCNLHSSHNIVNGNFKLGICNWHREGEVVFQEECGIVLGLGSALFQSIYIDKGDHIFEVTVEGEGAVILQTSTWMIRQNFSGKQTVCIAHTFLEKGDLEIKITSAKQVVLKQVMIKR